jgi:hypothetical protein
LHLAKLTCFYATLIDPYYNNQQWMAFGKRMSPKPSHSKRRPDTPLSPAYPNDDLTIASKNPKAIIDALEAKPNNFKLKRTGGVDVLLGCNFFRDGDGCLCYSPKNYLKKMCVQYKLLFGTSPKFETNPLVEN